jgi:glycosyltransferase involved in cell wall biosynthesis
MSYESPPVEVANHRATAIDREPVDDTTVTGVGLLVGIPAYNAAGSVVDVVRSALPHADAVLVVDDGSTDGTGDRAREAGASVVTHPVNCGYGAALKSIFREAEARGARQLVILDSDGQHDPADIPRLVAALSDPTGPQDVVIGSRFVAGGATDAPLYRRFGLAVVNGLTNLSLGTVGSRRIADTQSGFRAYSSRAVASLAADDTIGDRMEASLDVLYHVSRLNYRVTEVGTTITYDVENASTDNPISHGLELVGTILRRSLRDRPLVSMALTATAIAVATSLLSGRRRT